MGVGVPAPVFFCTQRRRVAELIYEAESEAEKNISTNESD
jgi:hypothetical protein